MGQGYYHYLPSDQYSVWKSELQQSLTMMETEHSYLTLHSKALSSSNSYIKDVVNVSFLSNGSNSTVGLLFNLNDATQLLIAKTLNVIASDLKNINLQNPDAYFVLNNLLNDYFINLEQFNQEIIDYLLNLTNKTSDNLIIIFVIAIILEFLGILLLGFLGLVIIKYENRILALFLEIPMFKAKHHFLKCEAFLIQLQQGNEDEDVYEEETSFVDSQDNEDEFKSSIGKNSSKMKKRKKFKLKAGNIRSFLTKIVLCICIIEIFFIVNYFTLKTIFDKQVNIYFFFIFTMLTTFFN